MFESLSNMFTGSETKAQAQQGGRTRRRRRGRKCRGGDETSDPTASMQGGRRRRGRKSRKSRRGTRKHTRRHRR